MHKLQLVATKLIVGPRLKLLRTTLDHAEIVASVSGKVSRYVKMDGGLLQSYYRRK